MDIRYKLIGASGRFAGCTFPVGPGIHQVGRHASNQVVLGGDGSISRTHARLTVTSSGVTVEDLRSTNGTLVNGKRIQRSGVRAGDTIQFGDAVFFFQPAGAPDTAPRTKPCPAPGCAGVISPDGRCTACEESPLVCPRCGSLNPPDARFCRTDGARLEPADSPGPVPARGASPRFPAGSSAATRTINTAGSRVPGASPSAGSLGAESRRTAAPARSVRSVALTSEVLKQPDIPCCPVCRANVGSQAELCPRCHSRIRRCASGHIAPASAVQCPRCSSPLLAAPERWGAFRGASSSGWTPEAIRPPLRLAWKFRPPEGAVQWTSPVRGSGAAFAGASDNFLYAIRGGIALWRTPLDGPVRTDFVPETCVPAWSDGRVHIGHMAGAVATYRAEDGGLLWQTALDGLPSSPLRPARGTLFVGVTVNPSEGAVCSLGSDGAVLWRHRTDGPVYSCPAYSSGVILVTTASGAVLALDAATGDQLWQHQEQSDEFATSPAIARETAFVTSHDGKLLCLALRTGEVLRRWTSPTGNFIHSSPAVGSGATEGEIFFGADDGAVYIVSAENARTISTHQTGGMVMGSAALADDLAYVGSQDGSIYVIGPQPYRIDTAYRLTQGVHIASSPAVGDGQLVFAASDGCLYALESVTAAEREP